MQVAYYDIVYFCTSYSIYYVVHIATLFIFKILGGGGGGGGKGGGGR